MAGQKSVEALGQAKQFMYRQARLLDRRRYEFHFEQGSPEQVIAALRAYQNEDGGFGQALEPDIRCPHSQPVPVEMALRLMDEVSYVDSTIMEGIGRYLRGITRPAGGFPLATLAVNDYPHAPWWYREEDQLPSLNPTGNIIGLLYKLSAQHSFKEEEWFQSSVEYMWRQLDELNPYDYHDIVQAATFLEHAPDSERVQEYRVWLDELIKRPGIIELDPQAEGYVHKVLDWAPAPDHSVAKLVTAEDISRHLDHLLTEQQADGGWPIRWEAVSPACELEWRGSITIDRLLTLRAYGRLGSSASE
ncbi:prenyltransferase/squalene oxidase repeat-containing protein [Paenibacillus agilis]|uniref:Squalene cyclase C-terminal domain-containing protein n=1 Tax=Paenibacillus agilis TaxID=3020863 RepID=A0A559IPV5_9BACL|nr:prenyltransferase/squalene oxidase repeat-containing protein [Paenibacillus agilis]TVX89620.1 hypothetical protein FPZ44_17775 [Paenibacillus agilis]